MKIQVNASKAVKSIHSIQYLVNTDIIILDFLYSDHFSKLPLTVETMADFIFLRSKITADGDCSHEIKRCLLLGRKVMTNLDNILKSRDITLPTKVRLVKAVVFPIIMYGCELDYRES